ncbi:MAG: hypothetical protein ACRDTG_04580, partial [Pseudonocardiaceae bacterium]
FPNKEEKTNQKNKPTLPPTPSTPLAAVPDTGGSEGGAPLEPNTEPALTQVTSDPARDLVRTLRLPDGSRRPNRAELAELHRLTTQALARGWPPAALRTQALAGLNHGKVSDPVRVLLARLDPDRLLPADPPATPEQIAAANRRLHGRPTVEPDRTDAPASDHTRQQAHAAIRDQLAHRRPLRAMSSPSRSGSEAS